MSTALLNRISASAVGKKPKYKTTYNDVSVIGIVWMKRLSNRYAGKSETTATVNTTVKKVK